MSRIATDWAWKVKVRPSLKLILLSMADRADEEHQCFPSIARLSNDTGLNKKTIQSGLTVLVGMGIITDTGKRKGSSRRVKVYEISALTGSSQKRDHPKSGSLDVPKNGCIDDPKNGCPNQSVNHSMNHPDISFKNSAYDWDLVLRSWNAMAERNGLQKMRVLGDERKKAAKESFAKLNKLRKQSGKDALSFADFIEGYLSNVEYALTPFHKGKNNRGWRCDFKYAFDKKVTESLITEGELKR